MEHKDTFSRYAIFQLGSHQYQGIEGKTVSVQKIEGEAGAQIEIKEVLLRKTADDAVEIGQPFVKGAVLVASIVKQMRGPKLIVYHFRRRKKSRVKNGHRQEMTIIRVESI